MQLHMQNMRLHIIRALLIAHNEGFEELHDFCEIDELHEVKYLFCKELKRLKGNGPTAQLWVQYFEMVQLAKNFIEAERTGDFHQHLKYVRDMLPYFHASGHNLYAKSAHLYWQDMLSIKNKQKKMNLEELNKFSQLGYFTIRRNDKFRSGTWTDMCIEQNLMKHIKTSGGLIHGRGYEASVICKFISFSVVLVEITDAMESYTKVSYQSSEQHVDTSIARIFRDVSDLSKLVEFFERRNPFPMTSNIMSIGTGVIGSDKINCYKAKEIGNLAFKAIINDSFGSVKIGRKNKVLPLKATTSSVKIDDEIVSIDPTLIFQRASLSIQTKGDMARYLECELATYPLSLFNESGMRKAEKQQVQFYTNFNQMKDISCQKDSYFVIDGCFLLEKTYWKSAASVREIIDHYVDSIISKYSSNCCVVFEGYPEQVGECHTKVAERIRRQNKNLGHEVQFDESGTIFQNQEKFLSIDKNKVRLIQLICKELKKRNISIKIAEEDANVLIVKTAIQQMNEKNKTRIVGVHIDLLVILTAKARDMNNIFLYRQSKDNLDAYSSKSFKYPELNSIVLFLHAFSGCDTTSALYNQGKIKLLKLFTKSNDLLEDAQKFYDPNASVEEIAKAGIKIICRLYGAKAKEKQLHELRYDQFAKLSKRGPVKLEALPPTAGSALQHAYRTYLQVQLWLGNKKKAVDWGWRRKGSTIVPIYTADPLYPQDVLQKISCSCKSGCKIKSCTCKKHGLFCSSLCVSCNTETCSNIVEPNIEVPENGLLDVEENSQFMENIIEELDRLDESDESDEETTDNSNDGENIEPIAKKKKIK
ncbi:hypothetical protein TKK_0003040 [Trichogramma kaykai]|uniref:Tesmin/TSO1-like CXC domain-containing protein n=1 Tax=Trichogramma kaykai TaxID=54128 RepID=A0ABD2XRH0_9HYME